MGVYAALAGAALMVLWSGGPYAGPVMPVMTSPGRVAQAEFAAFRYVVSMFPGLPKTALRAGLPLVAFVEDIESGYRAPLTLTGAFSAFFAGVDLEDPRTFLEAQFPAMGLVSEKAPAKTALQSSPVLPVPEAIFRLPASTQAPPPPVLLASSSPVVAVYHTHTRESYLPEMPGGRALKPDDAHTDDPTINMTRVGQEVVKTLQQLGVPAVHSAAVHDKDGKLAAYIRSETTVQSLMKQYPSLKVLLDLHRDSQLRAHTTVLIRGRLMAKTMVVLGNDNKDWRKNYAFATAFIRVLEEKNPGLSSGVFPKPGRFNQHYSPNALLLEVGGVENSLEESLASARAIAQAIAQLVLAKAIH